MTHGPATPAHIRRYRRADIVTMVSATLVTVAAYLAMLGWHRLQQYVTWKVWVFVLIVAAVAALAGWLGKVVLVTGTLGTVVTLVWWIDAATEPETDITIPMGLAFVIGGAYLGALAVSLTAEGIRNAYERRARTSVT